MKIKQFEIWIADLNPRLGTEKGKVRPVIVVQTDLLNQAHPSTIICPITTNINLDSQILRIHLNKGLFGLKEDCDIMIDQIRAIDNRRLMRRVGQVGAEIANQIRENLMIVLGVE